MPSTYTGSGIELIADGEQSGSWGQTTNTNLQIIDRMVSQAGSISLSGTTHTLTVSDGTLSDGQYGVLVFGGTPSGTNTVTISPSDAKRTFIVKNSSGQSVVLTQGSGGNVTVLNGDSAIVYCDGAGAGAAVVDVSSTFITSNNLTVANNLSDLASASTARTNLGLGTAATLNVGTSANNIVQLNGSAQLPAVDGSLLTGIEGVPSGIIAIWSGAVSAIPSGWVICDGTNGTPNLTGQFVVHADADAAGTYNVGDTGGSNTVTLLEANLPGHTHSVSGTTGNAGTHSHTTSGNTGPSGTHTHTVSGNTGPSGNHTHNGSTSNTGAHNHSARGHNFAEPTNNFKFTPAINSINNIIPAGGNYFDNNSVISNTGAHSHNFTTAGGGDHTHTLSGANAAAGGDHTHTTSGNTDTVPDHTHTFSATSGSTGGGTAHENRPPYYALAYIMKT